MLLTFVDSIWRSAEFWGELASGKGSLPAKNFANLGIPEPRHNLELVNPRENEADARKTSLWRYAAILSLPVALFGVFSITATSNRINPSAW